MSYRDPLDAARARIAALEDLLDSPRFGLGAESAEGDDDGAGSLRDARIALAEERAASQGTIRELRSTEAALRQDLEDAHEDLIAERARRQAEVSLLRTKLDEAERSIQNNASLFEAEQTMQRAQAEADLARLRQQLVTRDTMIRELREEIRVHLGGDLPAIKAYYSAHVRAVSTELAEHGALARRLDKTLSEASLALSQLPPVDLRDREAMVERELAKRKVAVGEAEKQRVSERLARLEQELERVTAAEAELATRK